MSAINPSPTVDAKYFKTNMKLCDKVPTGPMLPIVILNTFPDTKYAMLTLINSIKLCANLDPLLERATLPINDKLVYETVSSFQISNVPITLKEILLLPTKTVYILTSLKSRVELSKKIYKTLSILPIRVNERKSVNSLLYKGDKNESLLTCFSLASMSKDLTKVAYATIKLLTELKRESTTFMIILPIVPLSVKELSTVELYGVKPIKPLHSPICKTISVLSIVPLITRKEPHILFLPISMLSVVRSKSKALVTSYVLSTNTSKFETVSTLATAVIGDIMSVFINNPECDIISLKALISLIYNVTRYNAGTSIFVMIPIYDVTIEFSFEILSSLSLTSESLTPIIPAISSAYMLLCNSIALIPTFEVVPPLMLDSVAVRVNSTKQVFQATIIPNTVPRMISFKVNLKRQNFSTVLYDTPISNKDSTYNDLPTLSSSGKEALNFIQVLAKPILMRENKDSSVFVADVKAAPALVQNGLVMSVLHFLCEATVFPLKLTLKHTTVDISAHQQF